MIKLIEVEVDEDQRGILRIDFSYLEELGHITHRDYKWRLIDPAQEGEAIAFLAADPNKLPQVVDAKSWRYWLPKFQIEYPIPCYAYPPAKQGLDAEEWAELYTLRAESKGPDGYPTWKDAAVSEKVSNGELRALLRRVLKEAICPSDLESDLREVVGD